MMSATAERDSLPKLGVPRSLFNTGLSPDPTINQYVVLDRCVWSVRDKHLTTNVCRLA